MARGGPRHRGEQRGHHHGRYAGTRQPPPLHEKVGERHLHARRGQPDHHGQRGAVHHGQQVARHGRHTKQGGAGRHEGGQESAFLGEGRRGEQGEHRARGHAQERDGGNRHEEVVGEGALEEPHGAVGPVAVEQRCQRREQHGLEGVDHHEHEQPQVAAGGEDARIGLRAQRAQHLPIAQAQQQRRHAGYLKRQPKPHVGLHHRPVWPHHPEAAQDQQHSGQRGQQPTRHHAAYESHRTPVHRPHQESRRHVQRKPRHDHHAAGPHEQERAQILAQHQLGRAKRQDEPTHLHHPGAFGIAVHERVGKPLRAQPPQPAQQQREAHHHDARRVEGGRRFAALPHPCTVPRVAIPHPQHRQRHQNLHRGQKHRPQAVAGRAQILGEHRDEHHAKHGLEADGDAHPGHAGDEAPGHDVARGRCVRRRGLGGSGAMRARARGRFADGQSSAHAVVGSRGCGAPVRCPREASSTARPWAARPRAAPRAGAGGAGGCGRVWRGRSPAAARSSRGVPAWRPAHPRRWRRGAA